MFNFNDSAKIKRINILYGSLKIELYSHRFFNLLINTKDCPVFLFNRG